MEQSTDQHDQTWLRSQLDRFMNYPVTGSIWDRYVILERLNQYLFTRLAAGTVCSERNVRLTYLVGYRNEGSNYYADPVFSPYSVEQLLKHQSNKPFTVYLLERADIHAQLLYLDNVNRTFTILDPFRSSHDLIDRLGQRISHYLGYRPYELACPGPQTVTGDRFCGAWTLLMAYLICRSSTNLETIYHELMASRLLDRLVAGFISYLYDDLAANNPRSLKEAWQLHRFLVAAVLQARWIFSRADLDYLRRRLNLAAYTSGAVYAASSHDRFFNLPDDLAALGLTPNPIDQILAPTQLTIIARTFLNRLGIGPGDALTTRSFYQWLLTIPTDRPIELPELLHMIQTQNHFELSPALQRRVGEVLTWLGQNVAEWPEWFQPTPNEWTFLVRVERPPGL